MPEYRKDLASSHISLGQLLRKLKKPAEAEESYRTALRIFTELTAEYPNILAYDDGMASSHNSLGNLLADRDKLEQALEQYRLAANIRTRLVREHPSIPEYKIELSGVYANMAIKLFEGDKATESLEWFRQAIELLEPINQSAASTNKSAAYLEECYEGRSKALDKLQRYSEGERDWDRYVELNAPQEKTAYSPGAGSDCWGKAWSARPSSMSPNSPGCRAKMQTCGTNSLVPIPWRQIGCLKSKWSTPTEPWNC